MPEPITLIAIGGGILALLARRKKPTQQEIPQAVAPIAKACGPEVGQRAVASAAAGAASGAAVGGPAAPYTAAAGAALNVALDKDVIKCGLKAINKAKEKLCKNADGLEKKIGVPGWGGMSCDQKLVFMVALSSVGVGAVIAGALTKVAAQAAAKEVSRATSAVVGNVDSAVKAMRRAGAPIPKGFDKWSKEQKVAFMAAMGPAGMTTLATGTLTGALAKNTVAEVKRFAGRAESAARRITGQLKLPSLSISVPKIKVPKLFGLSGLEGFGENLSDGNKLAAAGLIAGGVWLAARAAGYPRYALPAAAGAGLLAAYKGFELPLSGLG